MYHCYTKPNAFPFFLIFVCYFTVLTTSKGSDWGPMARDTRCDHCVLGDYNRICHQPGAGGYKALVRVTQLRLNGRRRMENRFLFMRFHSAVIVFIFIPYFGQLSPSQATSAHCLIHLTT